MRNMEVEMSGLYPNINQVNISNMGARIGGLNPVIIMPNMPNMELEMGRRYNEVPPSMQLQ